jgi:phage RecT family recombinase
MAQSASTEVAARTQANEIVEWMRSDERRNQIGMALPETVSLDRFERLTATALLANPEILKAERASLYLAILKAAQAGLVPDGKQGAIVVFGNKASFMPMIGGVRDTLAEYGWTLATSVIYAADEFAIDVAEGRVTHRQPRPGVDRGAAEGAYAQAVHRDGRRMAEMMTVAEINYVRDKSARSKNVWNDWWTRMAEKTVGHRLAKKLPLAEAERDRIARIVNEDFEPGAGAAVLYGQPRPELQPASTPTPQAASEDVADARPRRAAGRRRRRRRVQPAVEELARRGRRVHDRRRDLRGGRREGPRVDRVVPREGEGREAEGGHRLRRGLFQGGALVRTVESVIVVFGLFVLLFVVVPDLIDELRDARKGRRR